MHLVYPLPLPLPPSPPPKKKKLCITIVLDFSWDDYNTEEKLDTGVMRNSGDKQGALWSK